MLCQFRHVTRRLLRSQVHYNNRSIFVQRSTAITARTAQRRHLSSLAFSQPTTILFLAGLFPEPNASAAGVRTQFLVQQLARTPGVESIHYGTGAKPQPTNNSTSSNSTSKQELENLGVRFHHVPPNDSHGMDQFLKDCGAKDPDRSVLVIIDRFYGEEAYSFHIHNQCPKAAIVLDMQDMHSLRWHRQSIVENRDSNKNNEGDKQECDPLFDLPTGEGNLPSAHVTKLQRELASIHRSDLTLVCSPVEMEALHSIYQVPKDKLALASFFLDTIPSLSDTIPFEQRRDFVFIGGFRHDPNVDAVRHMQRLWPRIRTALGNGKNVNFHVYGPFCPRPLREECHNPPEGFYIHGFTKNSVEEIVGNKRVVLAPLRFGAGIKGKIVDAWTFGTPVVTTPIGSEGMEPSLNNVPGQHAPNGWGGYVANNSQDFVDGAVSLYSDETRWNQASQKGHDILSDLYGIHHWETILAELIDVSQTLETRRQKDFTRGLLWQQTTRSTEYFSKWIETKNNK